MTERDRAAVGVHLGGIVGQAELAQAGKHLGGEGFIDLDQIEVADLEPQALHQLAGRRHRTDAHDARRHAGRRHAEHAGTRRKAVAFHRIGGGDDHGGGPVIDPRGIARRHRAGIAERGAQLGELLGRGVGARMLVRVDQDGPAPAGISPTISSAK
jgi:hypothetical protein